MLLELVSEIAALANSVKRGQGKKWTVVVSLLVSIYRDEWAKKKSIDNYNMAQTAQSGTSDEDDDGEELKPRSTNVGPRRSTEDLLAELRKQVESVKET